MITKFFKVTIKNHSGSVDFSDVYQKDGKWCVAGYGCSGSYEEVMEFISKELGEVLNIERKKYERSSR